MGSGGLNCSVRHDACGTCYLNRASALTHNPTRRFRRVPGHVDAWGRQRYTMLSRCIFVSTFIVLQHPLGHVARTELQSSAWQKCQAAADAVPVQSTGG